MVGQMIREWVAALCNCHRQIQHGKQGEKLNLQVISRLADIELN
jgi:thymidylate synthase